MFRLKMIRVVAGLCLALAISSSAFANTVLSVAPASTTVNTGKSFAVDVNISGVADLYDFQLDLTFNPSILRATGVSEGAFLPSLYGPGSTLFIPGNIDNNGGSITFNADTLLSAEPGLTGGGTLLVFDFTAIGNGKSALNIDPATFILQDSTGATINASTTNGSVLVQGGTTVPEPPILLLLSTGLLAMAGLSLKKFKI
jgi:Cohesin domain